MSFRLVPKSMTLNGVMAVILRYFSEFGYSFIIPGALRKSSRSLSHLLMSSCLFLSRFMFLTFFIFRTFLKQKR